MGAPDPAIPAGAVDALRSTVLGDVFAPGQDDYEEARCVGNAMSDRRPALIVRFNQNVLPAA